MKTIKTLILALILTVFAAGSLWATDARAAAEAKPAPQATAQTKCPVLAGDINKEVYADYKGKRIYFCCAGCDAGVQERPGKIPEKAERTGRDLGTRPGRSS